MAQAAWIWWLGGGVLALAGLVLLWWSLFRDRARGRRRCPKCWYDMGGVPRLVCPECGGDARREKRLEKTRRRWRWAVLGLLLATGPAASAVVLKASQDGPWSLVPAALLVRLLPTESGSKLDYSASGPLPSHQQRAVAELLRRGGARAIPQPQWASVLRGTRVIDPPQRWSPGVPVPIHLNEFGWDPCIQISVRVADARGTAGRTMYEEFVALYMHRATRWSMLIDPLEAGDHVIECQVEIEADTNRGWGASELLWSGTVNFPIHIAPGATPSPAPVWDPSVAQQIADSASIRISPCRDGESGAWETNVMIIGKEGPDPDLLWVELGAALLVPGDVVPLSATGQPRPRFRGVDGPLFQSFDGIVQEVPASLAQQCWVRIFGVPPTDPEGLRTGRYWQGEVLFCAQSVEGQPGQFRFEPIVGDPLDARGGSSER